MSRSDADHIMNQIPHNGPQPDLILDIRVRVPHGNGAANFHVTQAVGRRVDHLVVEAVHPAIDRQSPPRFNVHKLEPGERYRTRDGMLAGVEMVRPDRVIEGWIQFDEGRTKICWYADGRMVPGRDDPLDLMPGATDHRGVTHDAELDGPREIHDPEYVPSIKDLMRKNREALEPQNAERIDNIEKHCEAMQGRLEKLDAQATDLFRQLRGVRGNAQEDKRDLLARIEETEKRLDRLVPHLTTKDAVVGIADRITALEEARVWIERRHLYTVAYDGFTGFLIGRYTTLKGEQGVVLQMPDTNIVHVYKAKHIEGQ